MNSISELRQSLGVDDTNNKHRFIKPVETFDIEMPEQNLYWDHHYVISYIKGLSKNLYISHYNDLHIMIKDNNELLAYPDHNYKNLMCITLIIPHMGTIVDEMKIRFIVDKSKITHFGNLMSARYLKVSRLCKYEYSTIKNHLTNHTVLMHTYYIEKLLAVSPEHKKYNQYISDGGILKN